MGNGLGNRYNEEVLKVNLLQPPEDLPVLVDLLKKRAEAVCSISRICNDERLVCKGVMVSWENPKESQEGCAMQGIITHVSSNDLSSCSIDLGIRPLGKPDEMKISLDTGQLFTMYCPLTEIIFILLEAGTAKQVLDYGCNFIKLPSAYDKLLGNSSVFLCDPLDKNHVSIRRGVMKEYYGLDIRHNAVCDYSCAGLPVFSESGQLIAIQKKPLFS